MDGLNEGNAGSIGSLARQERPESHAERIESAIKRLSRARLLLKNFVDDFCHEGQESSDNKNAPEAIRSYHSTLVSSPKQIEEEAEIISDQVARLRELLGM